MWLIPTLVQFLGLLLGQPAGPEPSETFLSEMRGQEIAMNRCASCHAIGRSGASPDHEAPPFRELQVRAPLLFEDPDFNRRMTVDHPVMPDFTLTEQERADITAYVRSLDRPAEDFAR